MISSEKPNRFRVVGSSQNEADSSASLDPNSTSEAGADGACPHCFGTGMEVVSGIGARRCRCQTPEHRDRLFQSARIPPRYQHCTLGNYDAGTSDSKWRAKMEAQIVFDDFAAIDGR